MLFNLENVKEILCGYQKRVKFMYIDDYKEKEQATLSAHSHILDLKRKTRDLSVVFCCSQLGQ